MKEEKKGKKGKEEESNRGMVVVPYAQGLIDTKFYIDFKTLLNRFVLYFIIDYCCSNYK